MEKQIFGEFMGTLVLILMGNGVVANVSLRKSKAENAGWMVVAAGWAFAVMCGVFTAVACGSGGAHLNPAITLSAAVVTGDFSKFLALYRGAACRRVLRGHAWCGSTFIRTGARPRTPQSKQRLFLYCASHSQPRLQPLLRGGGRVCPGAGGERHRLESGGLGGSGSGPVSLPGGLPGVGHRAEPGRDDGLCH